MKVISVSAVPLVLLVAVCTSASPMFGTGGMMRRKFPGAADMSYRTYREIAKSNSRGGATPSASSGVVARTGSFPAAAVPRTGGSGSSESSWMFGNGLATPSFSSSSNQAAALSYNRPQSSFNQQGLPYDIQSLDYQNSFVGRYPSHWDPRDSYAFLEFPYHAPAPLDYEGYAPQGKIYKNYY